MGKVLELFPSADWKMEKSLPAPAAPERLAAGERFPAVAAAGEPSALAGWAGPRDDLDAA